MDWQLDVGNFVGLVAGALIMMVGAFVFTAKPASTLHRLFFVLAMLDGASTIFFGLALMADSPVDRRVFFATYYYHFLAFLTLLGIFGLVFPRPIFGGRGGSLLRIGAPLLAGGGLIALYVTNHDLFWVSDASNVLFGVRMAPLGNLLNIAFGALPALLVLRFTNAFAREESVSHRRQATYVLAGMVIAYAPFPTTVVMQALATSPASFVSGRPDRILSYWSFAVVVVLLVASAIKVLRDHRPHVRAERKFMQGAYGVVAMFTLGALVFPTDLVGALIRSVALLAYPLLLGYAIVRYEVFDIDRRLGRAATYSVVAAVMGLGFILGENLLQDQLSEFIETDSAFLRGSLAAIGAAAISAPAAKFADKLRRRVLPEPTESDLDARKREIYLHSLEGAMADGILAANESRALAALRESLDITAEEHEALLSRILARQASAKAPSAAPA